MVNNRGANLLYENESSYLLTESERFHLLSSAHDGYEVPKGVTLIRKELHSSERIDEFIHLSNQGTMSLILILSRFEHFLYLKVGWNNIFTKFLWQKTNWFDQMLIISNSLQINFFVFLHFFPFIKKNMFFSFFQNSFSP